jgi:Ca2+-binding EF-hand superfamily protein
MPLTRFQKQKLATMFAALDVDHDGTIQLSDYTRRVEAVARMKGWLRDSEQYARNYGFALAEWGNLSESADRDGDGRVTLQEFLRYGDIFLDDRDAVRSYAHGDVQLLFDAMDTERDGRITEAEYRAYLEVCGVDRSAADAFFHYADLNEDGYITRAEMSHAVEEFLLSENPDAAGNFLFGPLVPYPEDA